MTAMFDAALQVHRVHAGGNRLGAFAHDRLGEHGRRGGAVASDIIGLGGDFAHHLGAHVLELVLKLDFLRDRHAVLGGARRAEGLVDHDVAALGTERHLDRVGENVDAAQHALAGFAGESYVFGGHGCGSLIEWLIENDGNDQAAFLTAALPSMNAHDVGFLHDQVFVAVDLDFGARPFAEQDDDRQP